MNAYNLGITHATAQGKRPEQQDRYICQRIDIGKLDRHGSGWLLAVMDGHEGNSVADCIKENLPMLFSYALGKQEGDVGKAIQSSIRSLNLRTRLKEDGSTLSMVYVPVDSLVAYVSVIGDSPVIIRDNQGKISISPEHNVYTNIAEQKAAIKRGAMYRDMEPFGYSAGYISDPFASDGLSLQLSRAFGDAELYRFLSRKPELYSVELGSGSFVVVASDGVARSSSKRSIDQLVERVVAGEDANRLVEGPKGDNATAIVLGVH